MASTIISARMVPARLGIRAICLIVPALASSLHSEETETPLEIEPMVVQASRPTREALPPAPVFSNVDVLSEETLRELQITTARQAVERIPNVAITQADSARAPSFSVRGSHEITFHEFTGGHSGVGFYVDNIPSFDVYGRDLTLFSVERLSFYKGPHGTSMGIPHSMGVMDVHTKPPGSVLEGKLDLAGGSYGLFQSVVNASGPISNTLFFGFDGIHSRDHGWYEDVLNGTSYGKHETSGGRARLRWVPNDRLEINFTTGLSSHDDDPAVYVASATTRDRYQTYTSPEAYADGWQNYQALSAVWKSDDGWQLKSITARQEAEFDDFDPVLLKNIFDPFSLPRRRDQNVTTWSQEIRAESVDPEAALTWRTGVFLGWQNSDLDHFMLGLGPWEGANGIHYRQDDHAIYGELTRRFGEHLELSGGLRLQTTRNHTVSDFEPTAFAVSIGGAAAETDDRANFNAVLPMAAAAWRWTKDQRTYFRFSSGMQPGGLAVASAGSTDYEPERSFHLELGHESGYCNGLVTTRTDVFYSRYRDYQSFQFNPAGQTVFNAPRAHSWGAEAEITFRPQEDLELYVGAGCTKAWYDEFESPIGDFSGNRINNIPSATINAGATWHAAWGGVARIDWRYVGDTWFDPGNTVRQTAYSLLDGRIGYEHGRFGGYFFARNLLDEEYYTNTYLFQGVATAAPGSPRMVGIEMRMEF